MKLILDTDIGTDIDDAVALALCLNSPELELVGVTTVNSDTELRARIARKLIHLSGQSVPVAIGVGPPLLRDKQHGWMGHEGEGFLAEDDPEWEELKSPLHAVDYIIEQAEKYPGELVLAPIGAMTNLALALLKEPRLVDWVSRIVAMGGVLRIAPDMLYLPPIEHNIFCDPEAAKIVLESGIPVNLVPLDVTQRTRVTRADMQAFQAREDGVARGLAAMLARWLSIREADSTPMHDPLALASLIDPELLTLAPMRLSVQLAGELRGQIIWHLDENSPSSVAVGVDAERFHRLLRERLLP